MYEYHVVERLSLGKQSVAAMFDSMEQTAMYLTKCLLEGTNWRSPDSYVVLDQVDLFYHVLNIDLPLNADLYKNSLFPGMAIKPGLSFESDMKDLNFQVVPSIPKNIEKFRKKVKSVSILTYKDNEILDLRDGKLGTTEYFSTGSVEELFEFIQADESVSFHLSAAYNELTRKAMIVRRRKNAQLKAETRCSKPRKAFQSKPKSKGFG